ncbi:MAG: hypothetical protein RLZZ04_735 [Cyanobacteriota bacterium]|jgi:hypothetical protein
MKTVRTIIFILVLSCLIGCGQLQLDNYVNYPQGDRLIPSLSDYPKGTLRDRPGKTRNLAAANSKLSEVTSPQIIHELKQELVQYSPQVRIIEPRAEKTFNQTDVTLKLAVEDLPIFQDDRLHLGNHLNLIVDNEPFQSIYSLDEPITIKNLAPGTHTVRVFAVTPWGESFKNKGAYAQTTFNVLTQTNANQPNTDQPLLTYNSPTGTYGAEPLLLDFYLNAPNQAISPDSLNNPGHQPWQVKATINGTSFMIKDWQPHYLTGFEPGENWVQLELIDETGNNIENIFNNTVRVINYDPQQFNTLSKLVTDQISLEDAQPMVEQNYYIQPVGTPEIIEPRVATEPESEAKKTTTEIVTLEESKAQKPKVKDDKQKAIELEPSQAIATSEDNFEDNSEDNNSPVNPQNDTQEVVTEITKKPVIIPAPKINQTEKVTAETADTLEKNNSTPSIESTKSKQIITITEEKSDSLTPIAEIEIPQAESVEITEGEIAITVPSAETTAAPESTAETPLWLKKLLVGLRQRLEGLVKMLPSEI